MSPHSPELGETLDIYNRTPTPGTASRRTPQQLSGRRNLGTACDQPPSARSHTVCASGPGGFGRQADEFEQRQRTPTPTGHSRRSFSRSDSRVVSDATARGGNIWRLRDVHGGIQCRVRSGCSQNSARVGVRVEYAAMLLTHALGVCSVRGCEVNRGLRSTCRLRCSHGRGTSRICFARVPLSRRHPRRSRCGTTVSCSDPSAPLTHCTTGAGCRSSDQSDGEFYFGDGP